MKFEWDENKNLINKQKHKISFETAVYVFDDPYYIEMFDFEHSVDEDCKELSPAMLKAFKSVVVQRNRRKKA